MKTAIVTGCSTGIGLETAKALAEKECRVFAGARSPADLQHLDRLHERITAVKLDVTSKADLESVLDRLPTDSLDLLVNNAGISLAGAVEAASMPLMRQMFEVNVFGSWAMIRKALPLLRQAQGRVINVTSVTGFVAVPGGGGYAASKFALEALSDALRMEMHSCGVDVIVVRPGQIRTPIHDKIIDAIGADDAGPDLMYEPLMRAMTELVAGGVDSPTEPREVADVIVAAATSPNPSTRYGVGHDFPDWEQLRDLPDRERDAQILALMDLA